jgi:hypothetical protein
MALPLIENYDDEKLNQLLVAVLVETERRKNLATIPSQIADLKAKFIDGGGDPAALEPDVS